MSERERCRCVYPDKCFCTPEQKGERGGRDLKPCPFCGEDDFDLHGLKAHLENGWCDPYEALPSTLALTAGRGREPEAGCCTSCGGGIETIRTVVTWTAFGRNAQDFQWQRGQATLRLCEDCWANEWDQCEDCGAAIEADHRGFGLEPNDWPYLCPDCALYRGYEVIVPVNSPTAEEVLRALDEIRATPTGSEG